MMQNNSITIGGIELTLKQTPKGPLISTKMKEIEPLAWIVNLALEGSLRGLREALEQRTEVHYKGLRAVPDDAGNYTLSSTAFPTTMTLPTATIVEVLDTLAAQRSAKQPTAIRPQSDPRHEERPFIAAVGAVERPDLPTGWQDLERRASELDRLVTRERTVDNVAEESAKRRFLLLDLLDKGVFERTVEIPDDLPCLKAYHAAGIAVASYLQSAERFELNPDATPDAIVGCRVSVDWFRLPQSEHPSHMSAVEWIAFVENMIARSELTGGQGEFYVNVRGDWWTLLWRTDDGVHPAAVAAMHSSLV